MGQSILTGWPGNKSDTLALLYGVSLKILIAFEKSRPEAVVGEKTISVESIF